MDDITQKNDERFSILVCIDGSDESLRGLHYAIKFSLDRADTDISLLYVRSAEQVRSGGLNMSLSREIMLDWDLELPGLRCLKIARDMLVESGFLGEEWEAEEIDKKARGSRLGDHTVKYTSARTGQHISLILREASSVLSGILDEAHFYHYDIVIVSASDGTGRGIGQIDQMTAISVATEHDGTVIMVRELEEGHGHLVCVNESEMTLDMVRKDAEYASRCGCPIYLYAVAEDEEQVDSAKRALDKAELLIEQMGFGVLAKDMDIGDPVQRIIEKGRPYSLIVMAATSRSTLRRLFMGSVTHDVLKKAKNSVMIIR